jgi:CheY-like chemotaxis protein
MARILVIDDDEFLPVIVAQYLKEDGHTPVIATDGLEGLKLVNAEHFDLIITDINMPQLDGLEVVRLAKASHHNKTTPMVVVSGNLNQSNLGKIKQLGLVDVLAKPFELADVRKLVRTRLGTAQKKVAYEAFVVAALKESTAEIMSFYGGKHLSCGEPFVQRAAAPEGSTTGVVALFGRRVHGSLSVVCEDGFLRFLAAQIFLNDAAGLDGSFNTSLGSELANQIAGKVKERLRAEKLFVVLGIPGIVGGSGLPQMVSSPRIAVTVSSPRGAATVEMALNDLNDMLPNEAESPKPIFVYS